MFLLIELFCMNLETIVGLIASIISASTMIPQLIKIIKEKKAEGLSKGMLFIIIIGLSVWIYYGVLKKDWIIIGSNTIAVIINVITLIFTFKYATKK